MSLHERWQSLAHSGKALPGASVPALWGLYNAFWLAVMGAFGSTFVDLYLYAGAVALTELFAGWIVLWRRLPAGREPGILPVPLRPDLAILGAVAVLFGGLAAVFGLWFVPMVGATLVLFVIVLRGKRGFASHHRAVRHVE